MPLANGRAVHRKGCLILAAAAILSAASPAFAATWDGGTGIWSTTVGHWDGGANWVQGSAAVFPSPGGTVNLGEAIMAAGLTFSAAGYTIDLNGFNLTQAGAVSGGGNAIITNSSAALATYSFDTPPSGAPLLTGNMNVTFAGTGTWIPIANQTFTGTLAVTAGGTLRTDAGSTSLGSAAGTIRLEGASVLNLGGGLINTYTRDLELVGTNTRVTSNGLKMNFLTGEVRGDDLNIIGNQGTTVLAAQNSFTGVVNVTGVSGSGGSVAVAHNGALGQSTSIVFGSGDQAMFGLMANPTTGAGITLGTGVTLNLSAAVPTSGAGMVHNFSGNNTFAGNIVMGSNSYRFFGVEAGSQLVLSGVVGSVNGGRGLWKTDGGELVLTGANRYGTGNVSDGSNGTRIDDGTLRLDFSLASVTSDIINHPVGTDPSFSLTSNRSSQLVLGGGALLVVGKQGEANVQNFANRATHGWTINAGASSVAAILNEAASLTVNLGLLVEDSRNVGGTVDFMIPAGAVFNVPSSGTAANVAGAIITSNGSAFMTVGGTDWAAKDATNAFIVGGSEIAGFYTGNGGAALSGNADMSGGDTVLSADNTITSLRFHQSGAAGIDLDGHVLTAGGILVTPTGNTINAIVNGTLQAALATNAARQDLVLIQNNPSGPLVIQAVIADNTTASALTKSGLGTVELTSANTYTGQTVLAQGTLKLSNAGALGSGNVLFNGGVLGLTAESGDFTRGLGTAAGQVQFAGSGGFAAYDGTRVVNIGGLATPSQLVWNNGSWGLTGYGTGAFVATGSKFILGADDATGTVDVVNRLSLLGGSGNLTLLQRTIEVRNGTARVDGRISGVVSSAESGLTKTGPGTLELSAVNTYQGPTIVEDGELLITGALHVASPVAVKISGTLSGTGSVGAVVVGPGGRLAPGVEVGIFNTRNLAFEGGTLALEFESASSFDQVNVTGSIALNAPVALTLTLATTFAENVAFTILNNDGSDAIAFANPDALFTHAGNALTEGEIFTVTGGFGEQAFQITYAGGTGNDVILTTIPEPASATMLLGGLACLAGARRRRARLSSLR